MPPAVTSRARLTGTSAGAIICAVPGGQSVLCRGGGASPPDVESGRKPQVVCLEREILEVCTTEQTPLMKVRRIRDHAQELWTDQRRDDAPPCVRETDERETDYACGRTVHRPDNVSGAYAARSSPKPPHGAFGPGDPSQRPRRPSGIAATASAKRRRFRVHRSWTPMGSWCMAHHGLHGRQGDRPPGLCHRPSAGPEGACCAVPRGRAAGA